MDSPPLLTRKTFVKTFLLAVAHSSLPGRSWTTAVASELHPNALPVPTLQVRLQDFPALQNDFGSVRIAINPINGNSGPSGTFYPVILNRGPNSTFYAVSSRCTHQGCVVEALDASTNRMNCFCHGSEYAIDGKRISGPATSALSKYAVAFDGTDLLSVQIPALGYTVAIQPVAAAGKRWMLSFRSFRNVEYEVLYRATADAVPTVVPFALTESDPVDQTVFSARSAANVKLFVESESPSGFYTVSIRVSEV
jgi:Rieske Fe-S protein